MAAEKTSIRRVWLGDLLVNENSKVTTFSQLKSGNDTVLLSITFDDQSTIRRQLYFLSILFNSSLNCLM